MSAKNPGQGAARAAGRRGRAAGLRPNDQGRRARHRCDQQEPSRKRSRRATSARICTFRLAVIPIHVSARYASGRRTSPPLVRHYMDYFSRENNVRPKRILQAALDALTRYRWKGNIRRAAQHRRAADHHDRRRHDSICPTCPGGPVAVRRGRFRSVCGAEERRRLRRREAGDRSANSRKTPNACFLVGKLRENGWNISKTAESSVRRAAICTRRLEQYQISQETDG